MMEHRLPTMEDLLWPILEVLEKQGGSASIHELSEYVASELVLADEILNVPHGKGHSLRWIIRQHELAHT